MAADATRRKLFKGAASFFPLIAQIVPRTLQHRYSFVSDEWFRDAWNTGKLSVAERNYIIVLDVLEKSHLAASIAFSKAPSPATCRSSLRTNLSSSST